MFHSFTKFALTLMVLMLAVGNANAEGNSKVSLKISGWVAKAPIVWDDGADAKSSVVNTQKKKNQRSKRKQKQ